MTVLEAIRDRLQRDGIEYRELHHEPTRTSEDAARVRGEDLGNGGKALLIKVDQDFALFVLPADRRVDSKAIRKELAARKTRFASREELMDLTAAEHRDGLVPGSVPPFGEPILPFPLYVDLAIRDNQRIAFNAGSLTDSIIIRVEDYLSIAQPRRMFTFSQAVESQPH